MATIENDTNVQETVKTQDGSETGNTNQQGGPEAQETNPQDGSETEEPNPKPEDTKVPGLVDESGKYNGYNYEEPQAFVTLQEQKKFRYNEVKNFETLKDKSIYEQSGQPTGDLVEVKF